MPRRTARRTGAPARNRPSASDDSPAFLKVVAAFVDDPDVSLGRRFGSSNVLSANGKIFAMFVRGEFVAKLPRSQVEELLRTGAGVPWGPGTGRIMKEWVAVPRNEELWTELARRARAYATSP